MPKKRIHPDDAEALRRDREAALREDAGAEGRAAIDDEERAHDERGFDDEPPLDVDTELGVDWTAPEFRGHRPPTTPRVPPQGRGRRS